MGSDAHVIVVGDERLLDHAVRRIEELEARWSRFRPTSEISTLNRAGGAPVEVSADTAVLVRRAVDAWTLSAGFVDCTELDAVIAAGYDRSFDEIPADRPSANARARMRPTVPVAPGDVDVQGHTVRLPPGVGFDPGGIGKGLAADLVSAEVLAAGGAGVCVNLGGDLRVRGGGPDGQGWTISIDHPQASSPLGLLGLADGAVATSTTLRRRWRIGGELHHHLIDPRTGTSADSGLALVTAVAAEAWIAEALAKAILVRGVPHPFDLVGGTGIEAVVVADDGSITGSDGIGRFLGGRPLPASIEELVPA